MGGNKPGWSIGSVGVVAGNGVTILNRIIRKGFTEKETQTKNLRRGENSHESIGEQSVPHQRTSKCKGPEAEVCLTYSRTCLKSTSSH